MKVLAFRPRRPSRAEILRLVRAARCGPALAGMKRRAIPAGSRAKVGAAAEAIQPATPGNAGPMAHPAMTLAIASRTVPPWSESKAKGNSLSPVSRDTLTPGKRRVAAPCRQRQRVTSRGSRFSSRSTRRRVSSLSVLTSIAPVSA